MALLRNSAFDTICDSDLDRGFIPQRLRPRFIA